MAPIDPRPIQRHAKPLAPAPPAIPTSHRRKLLADADTLQLRSPRRGSRVETRGSEARCVGRRLLAPAAAERVAVETGPALGHERHDRAQREDGAGEEREAVLGRGPGFARVPGVGLGGCGFGVVGFYVVEEAHDGGEHGSVEGLVCPIQASSYEVAKLEDLEGNRETYINPTANNPTTPTFTALLICRFHSINTGRTTWNTSQMMYDASCA